LVRLKSCILLYSVVPGANVYLNRPDGDGTNPATLVLRRVVSPDSMRSSLTALASSLFLALRWTVTLKHGHVNHFSRDLIETLVGDSDIIFLLRNLRVSIGRTDQELGVGLCELCCIMDSTFSTETSHWAINETAQFVCQLLGWGTKQCSSRGTAGGGLNTVSIRPEIHVTRRRKLPVLNLDYLRRLRFVDKQELQ
jgi:hypothetical protein